MLFAQLTAAVINFSMRGPEKPVEMRELMPSEWRAGAAVKKETKAQMRKRVAIEIRAFFKGMADRQAAEQSKGANHGA